MACHEIAALRLGMMTVLGLNDEAEKQHELAELGDAAEEPGPVRTLVHAQNMKDLQANFSDSIALLEDRVAQMSADHPKLAYYRTLLVLTKKVDMDLKHASQSFTQLYQDLEEMHDYVHEVYPVEN